MATLANSDEQCPACLTKKSANPNLRFKINTNCYHRICESCIDRVYASGGQQPCPYPGCKNNFWKSAWRTQTFEDLRVEKEINIRREVYGTLKKEEADFVDKRAYDDFLELREMFIMNLLFGGKDEIATRRQLNDYREANGLERIKDDGSNRSKVRERLAKKVDDDYPDRSGLIEGLRKVVAPEVLPPFDPLEGMPVTHDYFTILPDGDTGYDQYRKNEIMAIAGYNLHDALEESLTRAFAGLGVFVQDEKLDATTRPPVAVSTGIAKDDVF